MSQIIGGTKNVLGCPDFIKGGKTFVHPPVAGLVIGQQPKKPLVPQFMNDGGTDVTGLAN